MPVESVFFVSGVVLLFVLFMVVLAWGERQTHSIAAKDRSATHPAE